MRLVSASPILRLGEVVFIFALKGVFIAHAYRAFLLIHLPEYHENTKNINAHRKLIM